jgi:hypothetical protein
MYALRIFGIQNKQLTCITTRTGLIVDPVSLKIENDLSAHKDCDFTLFDIAKQKEVAHGVVGKTFIKVDEPEPAPKAVKLDTKKIEAE